MSEGVVYSERPPISLGVLVSVVLPYFVGIIILMIGLAYNSAIVSITSALIIIIFVLVPFFTFPWIVNREIVLSPEGICVKFGFSKDKIPIDDIVSIEQVSLPKTFRGSMIVIMPLRYARGYGLFVPIGAEVVKSKGVKWYVFGRGRYYFKINSRSLDNDVCIGVARPDEFMEKWKMLKSEATGYSPKK